MSTRHPREQRGQLKQFRSAYVRWPMLYGNEEFVANGTVLDLSARTWRVAGTMPVRRGMRLNLWVWPPDRAESLLVEGATVLWVKGLEFGLEVQDLDPIDRLWLTPFWNRRVYWYELLRAA